LNYNNERTPISIIDTKWKGKEGLMKREEEREEMWLKEALPYNCVANLMREGEDMS
jgi:hypothetical protein